MSSYNKRVDKDFVLDKQGRRRFHGAFTGGFSAGYYNTCGSAEGWKPSTYSSSRKRKQRPEDFMDEEDDPMLGRKLSTKIAYGSNFKKKTDGDDLPFVPSNIVVVDSQPSVGLLMLRQLGWREGQGVGPLRERTKDHFAVSNSRIDRHRFAPKDVKELIVTPKTDNYGLGFVSSSQRGLRSLPDDSRRVYMGSVKDSKSKEFSDFYDFELTEEDDTEYTNSKRKEAFGAFALPAGSGRSFDRGKIERSGDGRITLPNFCRASASARSVEESFTNFQYSCPVPPPHFSGKHIFKTKLVLPKKKGKTRNDISSIPPPPPKGTSEIANVLSHFRPCPEQLDAVQREIKEREKESNVQPLDKVVVNKATQALSSRFAQSSSSSNAETLLDVGEKEKVVRLVVGKAKREVSKWEPTKLFRKRFFK
eukprot:g4989.t1